MKSACVAAALFPHAAMVLPEIANDKVLHLKATIESMQRAAELLVAKKVETLLIMSPHAYTFPDGAAIFTVPRLHGNLGDIGHPELSLSANTDMALAEEIIRQAAPLIPLHAIDTAWSEQYGRPVTIDKGTFVPLYYARQAGFTGNIIILSPRFSYYHTMTILADAAIKAAAQVSRRVAIMAACDLSQQASQVTDCDSIIMEALKNQHLSAIQQLPQETIDSSGISNVPSLYFLFGALPHMNPIMPICAYERPFDTGLAVALYLHDEGHRKAETPAHVHAHVELARQSISYYLQHHRLMPTPRPISEDLEDASGVFVSIYKGSRLCGRYGTFLPIHLSAAKEIICNAVSAATNHSYAPITMEDLDSLTITVDIVGNPESVSSIHELDPQKYGIVVMSHARTGLVLPAIEGIHTPQQQLTMAKEKAGIPPQVQPDIYRFAVTHYR